MSETSSILPEQFTAVNTALEVVDLEGAPALRVVKDTRLDEFDINTYAAVGDADFHNGVIEVEVQGRLLPDAPDYARGFVGIVFRAQGDGREFESYYVRPTNGRTCTDPVRRQHGCQYFSYPGYTFAYFREFGISEYEAALDIDLDEWIAIKAVIEDDHAVFYVNDYDTPALTVQDLKHGPDARGAVGIYVDTGTEGFARKLRVTRWD